MFGRTPVIPAAAAAAALLAATLAGCSSGSSAAGSAGSGSSAAPLTTVTLAISNDTNQTYIPVILAQQLGFFTKQGIKLQITNVANGSQTFTNMLAGKDDGVAGFYDHNIDLRAKGENTESVVQLNQAPGMVELVSTDKAASITSPAQLANVNFGITGAGSSTQFIADYLAVHNGVPLADFKVVPEQAGATFVAAMQHGQISAGITTEPTISALLDKKLAKVIVDMRSTTGTQAALGGPYPGTAITFPTAWVTAHKATVQKVVNAVVEALQWIQTHSAAQITAAMPASFYGSAGKTGYEEALANEIGMYSPTGAMVTDGPQSVFRVLSAFDPSVKNKQVDLQLTYTDEFVQNAS